MLDTKTAFDSLGLIFPNVVEHLYLNVTDDVTGWVKGQIFEYL